METTMGMTLLTPRDIDRLFRYPAGRAARLAKAGRIPFIRLPGGEIRFDQTEIEKLLTAAAGVKVVIPAARPGSEVKIKGIWNDDGSDIVIGQILGDSEARIV
jgi:hypothetical protein